MSNKLEKKLDEMIESCLDVLADTIKPKLEKRQTTVAHDKFYEASEQYVDDGENFDGWLPLTLATTRRYYDFTLQELQTVRDACRTVWATNEICANIAHHYKNFIVGNGLLLDIIPKDIEQDPVALAALKDDATIKQMKLNWAIFETKNKMYERLLNWAERVERDGEVLIRLFKGKDCPIVRFVEPYLIRSNDPDYALGVKFKGTEATGDREDTIGYFTVDLDGNEGFIKAEDAVFDKRNVDMESLRGISSAWPILTNLRRAEKILVNSSSLAAIQAAIAMVRKHKSATSAQVTNYLNKKSDGKTRTDPNTGANFRSQRIRPGTVLDTGQETDYVFPAHTVDAAGFVTIAEHELGHVAAKYVLPVDWLMAKEPTEPLTPGSPVVANFRTLQNRLYEKYVELFWKVQVRMGISEDAILKYDVAFTGPRLAIGKALDEARVDEINVRLGGSSPQEVASKAGLSWVQQRAQMIRHRKTAQPGEAMPGDAGNTQTSGGDGLSKAGGGQRGADGDGGNQKV